MTSLNEIQLLGLLEFAVKFNTNTGLIKGSRFSWHDRKQCSKIYVCMSRIRKSTYAWAKTKRQISVHLLHSC